MLLRRGGYLIIMLLHQRGEYTGGSGVEAEIVSDLNETVLGLGGHVQVSS